MMEDAILQAVLRLRRQTSGIPGAPSGLGSGSDRGDEVGGFGEYHLIDTAGYQMEGNDGEKTSALVGMDHLIILSGMFNS
jgi:hypothetical protein